MKRAKKKKKISYNIGVLNNSILFIVYFLQYSRHKNHGMATTRGRRDVTVTATMFPARALAIKKKKTVPARDGQSAGAAMKCAGRSQRHRSAAAAAAARALLSRTHPQQRSSVNIHTRMDLL